MKLVIIKDNKVECFSDYKAGAKRIGSSYDTIKRRISMSSAFILNNYNIYTDITITKSKRGKCGK